MQLRKLINFSSLKLVKFDVKTLQKNFKKLKIYKSNQYIKINKSKEQFVRFYRIQPFSNHLSFKFILFQINVRQQVEDKQVEVDVEVDDTAAGRACNELPASSSTDNNWSKQMQTYMNTSSLVSGAALFVKQQRVLDAEAEQVRNTICLDFFLNLRFSYFRLKTSVFFFF